VAIQKARDPVFLRPEETRICTRCGKTKDVRSFHRRANGTYHDWCKGCKLRVGAERWRELNPNFHPPRKRPADPVRERFKERLRQGDTLPEALLAINRTPGTYKGWRREVPNFAAECDAIRAKAKGTRLADDYLGGFANFRHKYFGFETYEHQLRLVHALEKTHPQHVTLCLLPPDHGKTTTIEDFICYTLAKDPNHRFGVVSQSGEHAKKIIHRCQERMHPSIATDFTARFGPFYQEGQERQGKPWTATHFSVWKSEHDERDPSVAAAGWTSKVYGSRWDTLIIDDIQQPESLASTASMLTVIRHTLLTRVGKAGRTVIIGTRVGVGDIYERLMEEDIPHEYIVLAACRPGTEPIEPIELRGKTLPGLEGQPLCPEMWGPVDLAERKRQSGKQTWACAYMQAPHSDELATFTGEYIDECKDYDRSVGRLEFGDFVVMGLDPALGGGNALSAFAFTIDRLHLLDCEKVFHLARTEDILNRVEEFAIRYQPRRLVVERDAFQKGLAYDERLRRLSNLYGFELIPHTSSRNKADEVLGVASMAGSFQRGEFRIPFSDELTRSRMNPLIEELLNWRPNISGNLLEQDLVMSCWFCWKNWMEMRDSIDVKPVREWRPSWLRTA
jgi:hypothetical protein